MVESATLNVRMDVETKEAFASFCDEVGISASSLMNMFAKTVVRNQAIPFLVTTKQISSGLSSYRRIFPHDGDDLEDMLSRSESIPLSECMTMKEGASIIKEHMGW